MRKVFAEQLEDYDALTTSATFRLPVDMKLELTGFALAEEDTLTNLLLEGAARVLQDRKQDPSAVEAVRETRAGILAAMEFQLAELKAETSQI